MSRGQISGRPWPYRLAALLGGLFLFTALHHVYVHAPATEKVARLRVEIDAARLTQHQQAQDRARVPKLEHELARLKQKTEMRSAEIAQVSDRPVLLAELSQIAQATGLEIVRLRPGKEIQRDGYMELPIQLGLEGQFHDLLRFLGVLAAIPHLNRLGKLTLIAHETVEDPLSLDIALEILTYALPETLDEHRIRSAAPSFARHSQTFVPSRVGKPPADPNSLNSLRDPFHAPELPLCNKALNGLESYDLNELRLVGIVWEPGEPKGLVMDGASAGHIIVPGSPIGNRGGIVEAITPTHVVVRENSRASTERSTSVNLPLFTFNKRPHNPKTLGQAHRKRTATDPPTATSPACRTIEAVRSNSH